MRLLKRVMSITTAVMMLFALCVQSEESNVTTYELKAGDQYSSASTVGMINNYDSSRRNVKVVKETGDTTNIVYIGPLDEYDNGAWENINVGNIPMIIFNWDDESVFYIIPVLEQAANNADMIEKSQSTNNIIELYSANRSVAETVQTNVSFIYNNTYHENVLLPGQSLSMPITVTNTGASEQEIVSYIATYDLSGKLIDLTQGNVIVVPANQTVTTTLSKSFSADVSCTAKVFLWGEANMSPMSSSVFLTMQSQDYYADVYTQAQEINFDKPLCGVINTNTDIDVIKFTPDATGIYAIQLSADSGTVCDVYNATQTLLTSVSASTENNYLLYALTAGQDYYIRFSGSENSNYKITPALPSALITVSKNIGAADSIFNTDDYNVYKFVPGSSGSHIITAVDSTNVKADLYNSSFEKVASSSVGDEDVSFRITSDMVANQEYYIIVSPKSETSLDSYTLYIEEPFALISIE